MTGQNSVLYSATVATTRLAVKCSKNWDSHPLTRQRMDHHYTERDTRQKARDFPPQKNKKSIIHRLVETWEKLPINIKTKENDNIAKSEIKKW